MRLIEVPVVVGPMKPQLLSLPRAGRLRIPLTLKTTMQTAYGARSYMRTAQIARKGSLTAQETRFFVNSSIRSSVRESRRWITQKHIQKVKAGEEQWAQFAAEIKAGKRKSFVEHLEERGLIHDVVG
jgi:tyrosyl-tRNA synthetase